MNDRGLSPVVGKALEAALVVLYLGMVTTALYGGAVPEYRAATGGELADRILAKATQRVQQAVPPNATAVEVRRRVDLPRTIAGQPYEIRTANRTLVLDHPDPAVATTSRLALPSGIVRVRGEWQSQRPAHVTVRSVDAGVVVALETGA